MAKQTRSKRKSEGTQRKTTTSTKSKAVKTKQSDVTETPTRRLALPPAWKIAWRSLQTLWQYRLIWAIVAAIYLLLDLLLVRSVAIFDVADLKQTLSPAVQQGPAIIIGGANVLSSLMTSAAAGASSGVAGAYRFFIVVLVSLVIIWLLRQSHSREGITSLNDIRTALYEGSTPLVPFLLILVLIGVQLLPLFVVMTVYSFALNGGIAATVLQQFGATVILFGTAFLTIIWLVRSIIALYIVTLPGMPPLRAYSNAKELVQGRRLNIMRKLLFLPLALFLAAAIVMVPTIIIWAPLAQWLFFLLTGVGFIAMHTYLYTLYRELLA